MSLSLLVPLDGSEKDDRALRAAAALAEMSGSAIHLLRILDTPIKNISRRGQKLGVADAARTIRSEMEQSVAQQAGLLATTTGRHVTSEVGESVDVARAIVDRAAHPDTMFVVMATRAAGALARAARGSVADRVMRESAQPVLMVPPIESDGVGIRLRRVLIPLDTSELAETAVDVLLGWEWAHQWDYLLLEVMTTPLIPDGGAGGMDATAPLDVARVRDHVEKRLHAVAERMRAAGAQSVQTSVVQALDAASTILLTAHKENVDLIAMGTRGRGGVRRLVFGSVAEGVVRGSDVPVLLFR